MDRSEFVPADQATMHQAATCVLARPSESGTGIEIFMLQRSAGSDFGGMFAFPGGKVDEADMHDDLLGLCRGMDEASANQRLEVDSGGLAYYVAVIRECFEEAGVLLAYDADADDGHLIDAADRDLEQYRQPVQAGDIDFLELCQQHGLLPAVDRLAYFSHWITPEGPPRRYDTRFFIAALPDDGRELTHDEYEAQDSLWIQPETALERFAAGEMNMITPTHTTLQEISGCSSADELLARARALEAIEARIPSAAMRREGRQG